LLVAISKHRSAGRLKREFHRYLKPAVLIIDELGYLPIDKHGADLLFQIISQREWFCLSKPDQRFDVSAPRW
jgi:DNA replication protein DnaC